MSTAATMWGFKLSEAADKAVKASDVTGYSSKTIYKWTTLYMNAVMDTMHESTIVEEDCIEDIISSERGHSTLSHPCGLINDEQFQLKADACVYPKQCMCERTTKSYNSKLFRMDYAELHLQYRYLCCNCEKMAA